MQRFVTDSRFDHIALITRTSDREVNIIEATVNKGVSTFPWYNFVKNHEYNEFEKIVWRKLLYNGNTDIIKDFIAVNFLVI